jgi:hypothetical protein
MCCGGSAREITGRSTAEGAHVLRHRLFNLFVVTSLALLFAVVTLWGRSYWISDCWRHPIGEHGFELISLRGELALRHSRGRWISWVWHDQRLVGADEAAYTWKPYCQWFWNGFGYRYESEAAGLFATGSVTRTFIMPYGGLALLTSLLPMYAAVRVLRRRRQSRCRGFGPARVADGPPHYPPTQRTATSSSGAIE